MCDSKSLAVKDVKLTFGNPLFFLKNTWNSYLIKISFITASLCGTSKESHPSISSIWIPWIRNMTNSQIAADLWEMQILTVQYTILIFIPVYGISHYRCCYEIFLIFTNLYLQNLILWVSKSIRYVEHKNVPLLCSFYP